MDVADQRTLWLQDYLGTTTPDRDVVEVDVNGFIYLYDATPNPNLDEADNRVVAVWGRSRLAIEPRSKNRMRGYPSPQRENKSAVDRGHLVAHSMGGGYDINLIPQLASVNQRGQWRSIERHLSANRGTFFYIHATYMDISDHPAALEYGYELPDGTVSVTEFPNL